jgi:ribosomal protein S1
VSDIEKERIIVSLSIKRCQKNPLEIVINKYKVGHIVQGIVKKIVDFGFVILQGSPDE